MELNKYITCRILIVSRITDSVTGNNSVNGIINTVLNRDIVIGSQIQRDHRSISLKCTASVSC